MKAMILAAGRGERLRPITDRMPKPLIHIGKYRLIEWHLHRLAAAGIEDIVINLSWLGDMIRAELGDGSRYAVNIRYSQEPYPPLETAGGIVHALDLLGTDPFIVVNGDVWTDFPFEQLQAPRKLVHLVMVPNPAHHPQGDFVLQNGLLSDQGTEGRYTYSGIGVYDPGLFRECEPGPSPLAPLLIDAMHQDEVTGEYFGGHWYDIGTAQRLHAIRQQLAVQQQDQ